MAELKTLDDWKRDYRKMEEFLQKELIDVYFKEEKLKIELCPVDDVSIPISELKKETIKWIKKIRLAKQWRAHQLSGGVSAFLRKKLPKPKESMTEEEIKYYLRFGGLIDDHPCDWIMHFYNITKRIYDETKKYS